MTISQVTLPGFLITSLLVSVTIGVFLLLRPLLRKMAGSQWLCALWLVLLARLLMPWPMESRWSLLNNWQTNAATNSPAAHTQWKVHTGPVQSEMVKGGEIANAAGTTQAARHTLSPGEILCFIWLSGVCIGIGILAWRVMQNRRLAAGVSLATDERLLNIYESIPLQWSRGVRLRMTDALTVPTLAGILRPQIWMPRSLPAQFTDAELRNVLLHETGHARRGDLAVQWLFALAQCIHWFNPLVWLAARTARFDREMACDAWTLERNGADHAGYGAALMKTIQLLRTPACATATLTAAMATGRRGLQVRVSGIGTFQPVPAWKGIAVGFTTAAVLVLMTTGRGAAQEKQQSTPAEAATPAPPLPQGAQGAPKTWGPQVAVKTDFFEISEADAKKLGLIDLISGMDARQLGYQETKGPDEKSSLPGGGVLQKEAADTLLAKLNKASSVKLLSAPSVTTASGQRAVIEIVREFRYPTEYEIDKKSGKAIPTSFETRNTGITLEVEPMVTPKQEIRLHLAPQIVTFLGFINYGVKSTGKIVKPAPGGDELDSLNFSMQQAQYEAGAESQPIFSTRKMTTSMALASGQSILLGGMRSELAKGRLIFILMSATIVEQDDKTATPTPATGSGN